MEKKKKVRQNEIEVKNVQGRTKSSIKRRRVIHPQKDVRKKKFRNKMTKRERQKRQKAIKREREKERIKKEKERERVGVFTKCI